MENGVDRIEFLISTNPGVPMRPMNKVASGGEISRILLALKNSLQENAKTHAIIENIIEIGHNGIVSWERESTMTPILLTGKDDHKKTKERWNIIHEYFEMKNIDYKEVSTIDGGILSKVICMIYILDYTSIYYAVRLGIDPSPINSIDFIKDRL